MKILLKNVFVFLGYLSTFIMLLICFRYLFLSINIFWLLAAIIPLFTYTLMEISPSIEIGVLIGQGLLACLISFQIPSVILLYIPFMCFQIYMLKKIQSNALYYINSIFNYFFLWFLTSAFVLHNFMDASTWNQVGYYAIMLFNSMLVVVEFYCSKQTRIHLIVSVTKLILYFLISSVLNNTGMLLLIYRVLELCCFFSMGTIIYHIKRNTQRV